VYVLDATVQAAHQRLDAILAEMRDMGLRAGGDLGDYRPLRALAAAVEHFGPDQLVIAEGRSSWLRLGLVDKARSTHPIPVTHVVSRQPANA
ncbi:MAG: amino acid permease, partial [Mycobacterium sp.]